MLYLAPAASAAQIRKMTELGIDSVSVHNIFNLWDKEGKLTWLYGNGSSEPDYPHPCGKVVPGTLVGMKLRHGARYAKFRGKGVYACHLAWFIYYGEWPSQPLISLSGDPDDLRKNNLVLLGQVHPDVLDAAAAAAENPAIPAKVGGTPLTFANKLPSERLAELGIGQAYLRTAFRLTAAGRLLCRWDSRGRKSGALPGTILPCGRRAISVQGVRLYSYQIAWCLHYREFPDKSVTILNGDPEDLRKENLHLEGRRKPRDPKGKSGIRGTCFDKRVKKWRAFSREGAKVKHLGYFLSSEEAGEVVANYEAGRL